jgi:hypothetical protein
MHTLTLPHQPPKLAPPPKSASTGNAYVDTFSAPPSKQATELWGNAGTQATAHAAADQAKFDAALPPMPVVLDGSEAKGAKGAPGGGKAPAKPPAAGAAPPGRTADADSGGADGHHRHHRRASDPAHRGQGGAQGRRPEADRPAADQLARRQD